MPTKPHHITIGFEVPITLRKKLTKPRELLRALTSFCSDLAAGIPFIDAKKNHPLGYEVMECLP